MTFSLNTFLANFSTLPSSLSRINVQRPKVSRPIFLLRNLPEYLYFVILKAQFQKANAFWMKRNFPKIFFQDFEKLVRGMQMGFFNIVICEKSVRDSSSVMNTFSLPYKCSFHFVYFTFSAFAQFFYSKTFELFPWIALVCICFLQKRRSYGKYLLSLLFIWYGP